MKRSSRVPLVLLGTFAAAGCSPTDTPPPQTLDIRQGQYASRQDCEKDWGSDPRNCQPQTPGGTGGTGGVAHVGAYGGAGGSADAGTYAGPRYYWDRDSGKPVVVEADGKTRAVPGDAGMARGAPSSAHESSTGATGTAGHGGEAGVSRGGFGATAHGGSGGG